MNSKTGAVAGRSMPAESHRIGIMGRIMQKDGRVDRYQRIMVTGAKIIGT